MLVEQSVSGQDARDLQWNEPVKDHEVRPFHGGCRDTQPERQLSQFFPRAFDHFARVGEIFAGSILEEESCVGIPQWRDQQGRYPDQRTDRPPGYEIQAEAVEEKPAQWSRSTGFVIRIRFHSTVPMMPQVMIPHRIQRAGDRIADEKFEDAMKRSFVLQLKMSQIVKDHAKSVEASGNDQNNEGIDPTRRIELSGQNCDSPRGSNPCPVSEGETKQPRKTRGLDPFPGRPGAFGRGLFERLF